MESDEKRRFEAVIARFDEENSRDPNRVEILGELVPRELFLAKRLGEWVLRLDPEASEALRIAARCQHIRRWEVKRESYPMDKGGYHRWKSHLKKFHAAIASEILRAGGYGEELIQAVQALNLKTSGSADAQTLEDALCLLFIEAQLQDLMGKSSEEKVINALQKSWAKMSLKARVLAEAIEVPAEVQRVIKKALYPDLPDMQQ